VVLLKNFLNIFKIPELRKKLLFTLGILIVYRFGNHIPVIGIDIDKLHQLMTQTTSVLGGLFAYIDLFSGGSLRQCTIFALGIAPYITASIMMQMLSMSVPSLELLAKEGEYGRKIINQYTRYLALIVSILQSSVYATVVENQGLFISPGWGFRIVFILSLVVGTMFVVWLSEQISLYGLGNGSSLIIFAGIIARFPDDIIKTISAVQEGYISLFMALIICAIVVAIASCIVFLEKGQRKIPVQYSRRVVGNKVYGGQSTYIPFKINPAGVMPVIMSNAVLNVPLFILSLLANRIEFLKGFASSFAYGGLVYNAVNFVLIIFFTFFYTALIFNPDELADNIKKSGGFIPGIRPGRKTAEFFNYILNRIGLVGALYIAILAVLPSILHAVLALPFYLSGIMSGTALLIGVGVALEIASQIESYLIENRYEGFLMTGRMTGRNLYYRGTR
jgi:preprotein translocase subunit SecY